MRTIRSLGPIPEVAARGSYGSGLPTARPQTPASAPLNPPNLPQPMQAKPIDRRVLTGPDTFQRPFSQIGNPGLRGLSRVPMLL